MPPDYFLTTPRLGFRLWHPDDFALAKGLWGDYNVTRLIDTRGPLTDEQIRARLLQEVANMQQYGVQYFPVFILSTGEHIGCCGVRPYDLNKQVYELGFHIRKKHWHQGYAGEAAMAMIAFAFTAINASSLFAGHHPRNESSQRVLAKLGFTYTHDEFYPPTGLEHPSYYLRKEDWEKHVEKQ